MRRLSSAGLAALIAAVTLAATRPPAPITVIDADGDTVRLATPARRVVSLVPSATDVIVALGATARLAGLTRYDVDPALATVPSVGSTVNPDLETIAALHPDLVISWHGAKRAALRAALARQGLTVYAAPVGDTADFFQSVDAIGLLLGRDSAASALTTRIRAELLAIHQSVMSAIDTPTVAFIMPGKPPISAGPHSFVAQLIGVAGGRNAFDDADTDWPRVSIEAIVRRHPAVILMASRDCADIQSMSVVGSRIVIVPPDLAERPGPRLAELARLFSQAIHP